MTYDHQILKILAEAGKRGISVQAISKHVYNMNCTFFFQPDYAEIHACVRKYLYRNSKSSHPLVESTGRRGFYRLSPMGHPEVLRMMIPFSDGQQEKEEEKPQQDLSLDLFA